MSYEEDNAYYIVMAVHLWDNTDVIVEEEEQEEIERTGKLKLKNLADDIPGLIGWVPVFSAPEAAEVYRELNIPEAQVTIVQKALPE